MSNCKNPKQNFQERLREYQNNHQLTDEEVDGFLKDNTDHTISEERLNRIWKLYGEKSQREKICSKCLFERELCICPFRRVEEDI